MSKFLMFVKVNVAYVVGSMIAMGMGSKEPQAIGVLCAVTFVALALQDDRDVHKTASAAFLERIKP